MALEDDPSIEAFLALPELRAGQVLDARFRIVRLLGEGAFGRVYEARDQRLERRVALKTVFTTGRIEPVRRLRREIELLKAIEHANVVRLYDAGEDVGVGVLYLAMELVHGRELGAVVHQEGAFELERALRVTYQVLDALAHALQHDVVHLDLKPENIVLTQEGLRRDVVKLLDFGIAKSVQSEEDIGLAKAAPTLAAGAPLYMAPEQIENRDLGPHTDVYAVAMILVEMLTGKPLFFGDDAMEIIARKAQVELTVPSGLVPPPLAAVLERALQSDHRQRYHSVVALYAALQDALDGSWGPRSIYARTVPEVERRKTTQFKRPMHASAHSVEAFFAQLDTAPRKAPVPAPASEVRPRSEVRRTLEMSDAALDALSPQAAPREEHPRTGFDEEAPTSRFRAEDGPSTATHKATLPPPAATLAAPVEARPEPAAPLPEPTASLEVAPPPPTASLPTRCAA